MKPASPSQPGDLLMITFDALRYDVAMSAWETGQTPFLRELIPTRWERRHTPGNFTFAAHAAFFAGFFPTPETPGPQTRPFALRFPGSRTVGQNTCQLDGENIVIGLRAKGYRTICIGGVGFFNPATPLGSVFPAMFDQSYWRTEFSVSQVRSPRAQVRQACECIANSPINEPLFLFLNISATHPPTHSYLPGTQADSVDTQAAALSYVDRALPELFAALKSRGRCGRGFLMSDHGTLFGEDGWTGHRVSHPDVWRVPYAEICWEPNS